MALYSVSQISLCKLIPMADTICIRLRDFKPSICCIYLSILLLDCLTSKAYFTVA